MTLRIDAVQLREPERTEEGYIRAEGVIAAPDVLEYRTKSGEVVKELVPPEALRDPEFLQSLEDKPLTLEHPDEQVNPENVSDLAVGDVGDVEWYEELQRPDGSKGPGVKGKVVIRDADAIEAYEDGTLELSPAYEVELERNENEHPKAKYDRVQKKRRAGNHVALTDRGRAGATARLRADSDAVVLRRDESVDDIDTTPPEGAREAARKALRWRDEHPDEIAGGTRVGWERANQLDDDEELSAETVMRMHSFFSRHMAQGNHEFDDEHEGEPWKDAGYVAHLLWGGDTGASWAERKSEQIKEARADAFLDREDTHPLGMCLKRALESRTADERTQQNVLKEVARSVPSGASTSGLRSVLSGETICPSDEVLEAFALVLDLNSQKLKRLRPSSTRGDAMPEKVRLDSEMSVKVPEDKAEKIRRWKEDQEEQQMELSQQVESARDEIESFKEEIKELEAERDELQEQIETKRKQLRMLADKMGLSEMMSGSEGNQPRQGEGAGSSQPQPNGDGMSEEKMDSLVAERLHEQAEARMDALEAAEMLALEVEGDESTSSIRERVVDAFYDDRDPERMDSAKVEARFDVACEELERRADERDESYDSASERADSDESPDAEQAYREQVYG